MTDATTETNSSDAINVALELMHTIVSKENKPDEEKTREYYLTLFYQCLKSTNQANSLDSILKPS